VALAVARGLTRHRGPEAPRTLGSFWVDLIRATVYVLLPISVVLGLFLVAQGALQTLAPYRELVTLEGAKQVLALGPVGSQEVIKQLGTNGGGFFNANSAHPFENPTPLANFVATFLIFAIPAALTWTYGKMARNQRQGWALFGAMLALFLAGYGVVTWAEHQPNPALAGLGVDQSAGNLEGKEVRLGVDATALFATVTTDASCGAVNGMHDSFNPLGGLVPLVNIQLGEIIFGGVGAGLYGMLVFVVLTVFIAGLMVGRTPELLGKKIEPREMKLATIYILIFPLVVLPLTAWASVTGSAAAAPNAGPHGLSEMLYAFSSAVGNNGSAFAGLDATKPFWTVGQGFAMLLGRFFMLLPILAIAGSMVGKKAVEPGPGTFPTDGWLFGALLVSVIVIVGALTFFPALTLGPLVEHFLAGAGKVF
jgi:K+-transporting ATPase ATPase A chain